MLSKTHWVLLLCLGLWTACQPSQDQGASKGLEFFFDFEDEAERLAAINPKVIKTTQQQGHKLTETLSVNWLQELDDYVQANINRTSIRDKYEMDMIKGGGSKVIKYTTTDDQLPVKTYELTYVEGFITSIYIKKANNLDQSELEELYYRPNIGYGRVTKQKIGPGKYEVVDEVTARILTPPYGVWRGELDINGERLPFNFDLNIYLDRLVMSFTNGESRMESKVVLLNRDSIKVGLPLEGSRIIAGVKDQKQMTGFWVSKPSGGRTERIPFMAEYGTTGRFTVAQDSAFADIKGEWEVTFGTGAEAYKGIAKLTQTGNQITADFINKTGDYSDLQGIVTGNDLYLSCFDGAHAYLMKATIDEHGMLRGSFWSGDGTNKTPWLGKRKQG